MRSPGPQLDFRAALTREVAAAIDELGQAPVGSKAVHRCRVRLKRARALARLGHYCAPGLARVFQSSARQIMHALAEARELASLALAARSIARNSSNNEAAALKAAALTLDHERQMLPRLDVEHIQMGLRDLLALAQVWPEVSPRQIMRGAERVRRRARRARRRSEASDKIERRHEWRRREKDRLYAMAVLGRAWPEKRRRSLSERLGEILGHERDALLLLERLQQQPNLADAPKAAKRARRALQRAAAKLARRADELGRRLHAGGA